MPSMPTLVHSDTKTPVKIGETITDFRGETAIVSGWETPHKPSSTGRVCVNRGDFEQHYYPSVFNLEWVL